MLMSSFFVSTSKRSFFFYYNYFYYKVITNKQILIVTRGTNYWNMQSPSSVEKKGEKKGDRKVKHVNYYVSRVSKRIKESTPANVRVQKGYKHAVAQLMEKILDEVGETCSKMSNGTSITSSDFNKAWESTLQNRFVHFFHPNTVVVSLKDDKNKRKKKNKKENEEGSEAEKGGS